MGFHRAPAQTGSDVCNAGLSLNRAKIVPSICLLILRKGESMFPWLFACFFKHTAYCAWKS